MTVAKPGVRATTFEDYRATVENHFVPGFGAIPVQRLFVVQVQEIYGRKRDSGVVARTIHHCHMWLSQALKQGVK